MLGLKGESSSKCCRQGLNQGQGAIRSRVCMYESVCFFCFFLRLQRLHTFHPKAIRQRRKIDEGLTSNERSQSGPAGVSVRWQGPVFSHAATQQLFDCSLMLWFR